METEPALLVINNILNIITINNITIGNVIGFFVVLLLLVASALISGSEVAFFSLSPSSIHSFKKEKSKNDKFVVKLLNEPKRLLGTILVTNNFINISIIIISTNLNNSIFNFSDSPILGFLFQIVIITFVLLLFGEIIPKVLATHYPAKFVVFTASPLFVLEKLFRPISSFLIYSTSFVEKKFQSKQNISMQDISKALDITSSSITEDKELLKGIADFGNIDVNEIMNPRVDIVAVEIKTDFKKLLSIIIDSGFSRIPVYSNTLDNIKGVLYIKDLLAHLDKPDTFKWQRLIRPPYFIPEKKKINDLLEEIQIKKVHIAIVVDEYGGTSGIVTLENILEEIVGEISDESDEEEINYTQIDDNNFIFEGKTLLNDFYKITSIDNTIFDDIKGEADTLAGLILELKGEIPKLYEEITYKNFIFKIEDANNRRIKMIKVTIN